MGRAVKQARRQVQALLGAKYDSEIIFTSCGTESDSTAILSALRAQPDRKEIITTVVEHPAVATIKRQLLATADAHDLYRRFGYEPMSEPDRWMARRRAEA